MKSQLDPIAVVTQDEGGNVIDVRLIARYMTKFERPTERMTCCEVTTTWSCGTFHPEEDCR